MIPHPSQAMLSAMRNHIETLPHVDREKLDRQLAAAWIAADRVRQDEAMAAGSHKRVAGWTPTA